MTAQLSACGVVAAEPASLLLPPPPPPPPTQQCGPLVRRDLVRYTRTSELPGFGGNPPLALGSTAIVLDYFMRKEGAQVEACVYAVDGFR